MKNIISYGGGTQSTALILMALNGEFGLERPDFAVFADTGGEPEFINEYVRYFTSYCKEKYDFDIFSIMHKSGLVHRLLDEEHKSRTGKFRVPSAPPFFTKNEDGSSGMLFRQCTPDYKIHPISKFINSKLQRGEPYKLWMGISFDERSRMRTSYLKKRINYYPLVENFVNRMDSVRYVRDQGVKAPSRSSCYFCPFHSDRYWKWLKNHHPKEFNKAVNFEHNVQKRMDNSSITQKVFLHRSCKPLGKIDFNQDTQIDMFPELIDECEGYCGI